MTSTVVQFSPWSGSDRARRIRRRILLDWAAGLGAAFTAAPIIMAVDKAVVQNTSGTGTIAGSIRETVGMLLRSPIKFFTSKEFMWIFFVYGSTYMAANSIDSLCKINHQNDVIPKLVGVTGVNMVASILKDRAFAYYYGKKAGNKVGAISMLLWLLRDVLTMAGAFVLPSRLANVVQEMGVEEPTARKMTQFALPVAFQILLTPVHLLGYDFFNYSNRSFGDRTAHIKRVYLGSVGIRMVRMGAAYGIGGNNNYTFRNYLISRAEGPLWNQVY